MESPTETPREDVKTLTKKKKKLKVIFWKDFTKTDVVISISLSWKYFSNS